MLQQQFVLSFIINFIKYTLCYLLSNEKNLHPLHPFSFPFFMGRRDFNLSFRKLFPKQTYFLFARELRYRFMFLTANKAFEEAKWSFLSFMFFYLLSLLLWTGSRPCLVMITIQTENRGEFHFIILILFFLVLLCASAWLSLSFVFIFIECFPVADETDIGVFTIPSLSRSLSLSMSLSILLMLYFFWVFLQSFLRNVCNKIIGCT